MITTNVFAIAIIFDLVGYVGVFDGVRADGAGGGGAVGEGGDVLIEVGEGGGSELVAVGGEGGFFGVFLVGVGGAFVVGGGRGVRW